MSKAILRMSHISGTRSNDSYAQCMDVFADMMDDEWQKLKSMDIREVFSHLSQEQKSTFLRCVLENSIFK